jgi:CheY-like chemotaxis protein
MSGPAKSSAAPAAPARPPRVLLVDDVAMSLQLAQILLTLLGWEVDERSDGQSALDALAHSAYDLVLIDCVMPGMDGFEATRRLRLREAAQPGRPRSTVIALTASTFDGDRQRCLDAGMDDYLAKPFTAEQFAAIVARWRPQQAAPCHLAQAVPGRPDGKDNPSVD